MITIGDLAQPEVATVLALLEERSNAVCDAVVRVGPTELERPSLLPGWSRLTIACHLRYGAQTTRHMIEATLMGKPSAFYPAGRGLQRETTLHPALGEAVAHVPASLVDECANLGAIARELSPDMWARELIQVDPDDLAMTSGPLDLWDLLLLRLTEVVVHSSDIDLGFGLDEWPADFGPAVLRQRLARLTSWPVAGDAVWRFQSIDGPGGDVVVDATGAARLRSSDAGTVSPDVEVSGRANDLVAALLGRRDVADLSVEGRPELWAALPDRLPGP